MLQDEHELTGLFGCVVADPLSEGGKEYFAYMYKINRRLVFHAFNQADNTATATAVKKPIRKNLLDQRVPKVYDSVYGLQFASI